MASKRKSQSKKGQSKSGAPAGQIRQSQIVTTFGPGSMVDLPNHSVIIGGLEHWHGERRPIYEDRLAARVAHILGVEQIAMYAPPVDTQDPTTPRTGVTAFTFPAWFVAQHEVDFQGFRSRPLVHWNALHKRQYLTQDRQRKPVVPVRIVQACPNGHISDIDWYGFVHRNYKDTCRGQLWLDEGGTSGDLADIWVRCEACKKRRPLSDAKLPKSNVLGPCFGERPWLGRGTGEGCVDPRTRKPHPNRLLVRSASNAYFSQTLSVIHIPERDQKLRAAIDEVWEDFLQYLEEVDDVKRERRKQKVHNAIANFTDAEVWAEIRRRKGGGDSAYKSIKQAEIETLLSASELGEDTLEGDFHATARSLADLPGPLVPLIERIVLIHRMREVTAQVGFTRFEAAMPDIDGELDLAVKRAALSVEPIWVPATENRGEGVFIAFKPDSIAAWLKRDEVKERLGHLADGFDAWAKARGATELSFPGGPYLMLHTLSHMLITTVSLECGYSASSIRERVYAGSGGYGILLHTGTPGAEGTLGGLIEVGRHIEHHLLRALEFGRLCSNDPVCATHEPDDDFEERFLHGAACHGCVLLAETSCERRNELLDRALVVPTVHTSGAAFFETLDGLELKPAPVAAPVATLQALAAPATGFDLGDFDEPWWPLLRALGASAGIEIEPGGDVPSKRGRVVGSYLALVRRGRAELYLLDVGERDSKKAADALTGAGKAVLILSPDTAPTAVLEAL